MKKENAKQKHFGIMIVVVLVLVFSLMACATITRTSDFDVTKSKLSEYCVGITETAAYYRISGFLYAGDVMNLWGDVHYLKGTDIRTIEIYLDSAGGSPHTGFAYVDVIGKAKKMGFTVNVRAYGQVASAAVPIVVVGSHRTCGKRTGFMMHKPYVPEIAPFGYPEEVFEMIKQGIRAVSEIYVQIIADHTKLSVSEAKGMLIVKGVYFDAYEALEMGFVDEVV